MVCNNIQQMITVTFCQIKRRLVTCSIRLQLGIGKLLISGHTKRASLLWTIWSFWLNNWGWLLNGTWCCIQPSIVFCHCRHYFCVAVKLYNAVIFQPELLKDAWAFFHSATFAAHPHPNIISLAALCGSDAHSTLLTTLRLWLIVVGCGVYQSRS